MTTYETHRRTPSAAERLYRGSRGQETVENHRRYQHNRSPSVPTTSGKTNGHTFTWMAEEEFLWMRNDRRRERKTEDWVREQQQRTRTMETEYYSARLLGREWEELASAWMRKEEQARRVAEEAERTRIRIRHELEERVQSRRRMEEAWEEHESRWAGLAGREGQLAGDEIPWPVLGGTMGEVSTEAVLGFLLSAGHSRGLGKKERVRRALLRWHPDRFGRYLRRVGEQDRPAVEAAVGIIVRALNAINY